MKYHRCYHLWYSCLNLYKTFVAFRAFKRYNEHIFTYITERKIKMSEQIVGYLNWHQPCYHSVQITIDEQGKFWGYKLINGLVRYNEDGSSMLFDCVTTIENRYRKYSENEIVSIGEKFVDSNGEVVATVVFRYGRCEVKHNSKSGSWAWVVDDVAYLAEGDKFNANFNKWYSMERNNFEARGYTLQFIGFKYFNRDGFIVNDESKTTRLYVAKRLLNSGKVAKKRIKIGLTGNRRAIMETTFRL